METKKDKKIQKTRTAMLTILVTVGCLVGVMSISVLVQAATPCITVESDPTISYGTCKSTDSAKNEVLSMSSSLYV
jgi:hypothetical protein